MKLQSFATVLVGTLTTAIVLAGCGSSGKGDSSGSAAKDTFVLGEFTVVPPSNTLHAGRVTITANNVGGEVHELVIVRAESISALPMKSDGSVDEDKIAASDKVGEIADVAARTHTSKAFNLKAGNYIAFCNVVDSMMDTSTMMDGSGMGSGMGHIHFSEGMHAPFTVT